MHALKRYAISYRILGEPETLTLESYEPPSLDQVRLQLLLKHLDEPQVVEDLPWETSSKSNLDTRGDEVGLSDIRIQSID